MIYRSIGVMSGSSLDGLDIAFVAFTETGGKWAYEILHTQCLPYSEAWKLRLSNATALSALDYQLLHADYGHFIGNAVNAFIEANQLLHQVNLIASHGHTTFHLPQQKMTAQLGDGAAIAATTRLPVVSDLRNLDVAFGGQGAPIVPIGEKLLMGDYQYLLNLGGIANISINKQGNYTAFDIGVANQIFNQLAAQKGLPFDDGGEIAASGSVNFALLQALNALPYYLQTGPKSLSNSFGASEVYPLIAAAALTIEDALCTYTEHLAQQINNAIRLPALPEPSKMLITGGGAYHSFLIQRLTHLLRDAQVEIVVPDAALIEFKEALIMALLGVLRWREEANVLSSVTGAAQNSIGGALWLGTEA